MRHTIVAAAMSLATLSASPAFATDYFVTVGPGTTSTDFGATATTSGTLDDRYFFTVPSGSANGFVGSIALSQLLDVTIDNVFLDQTPFDPVITGPRDFFTLDPTSIDAGQHFVRVVGSWGESGGSYSGTLNFSPAATTGVPEPTSWALMIGGFGLAGGALRRRKAQARTTVSFA